MTSSNMRTGLLLLILAITPVAGSVAGDFNRHLCNSRSAAGVEQLVKKNPALQRDCYAHARKLIRTATGHDSNLTEAEGIVDTLLLAQPDSAFPYIGSAELMMKKRELKTGSVHLSQIYQQARKATRIKPPNPAAYITFGRVNLMTNCPACAELAAEKARQLGSSGPDLAFLRSSLAESRNNLVDARAELNQALAAQTPELTSDIKLELYLRLSLLSAKEGRFVEAHDEIARAIEIEPASPVPYLARAELLFFQGDPEAAGKAAIEANKIKPMVAAKRVQSFAEYLSWANTYLAGDPAKDINRIIQRSLIPPEEAFIDSARYRAVVPITEAMLKAGVIKNINVKDGQGNTVMMAACRGNNPGLVSELIDRQANVNSQNSKGERALSFSILNGNQVVFSMLLGSGAEVNYIDVSGNSPLSLAVFKQDEAMVRELLARGASIQPVIDQARRIGIDEIEKIIRQMLPVSV